MDILGIGKWWQRQKKALSKASAEEQFEDQLLLAEREQQRQERLLFEQRQGEWQKAGPLEKAQILERRQKEVEAKGNAKLLLVEGWWLNVVKLLKANPGALYTVRDLDEAIKAETEEEQSFYRGFEIEFLIGQKVTYLSDGETRETSLYHMIQESGTIRIREIEGVHYFFYPKDDETTESRA